MLDELLYSHVKFQPWGASHLAVLALSLALSIALVLFGRRFPALGAHAALTRSLGAFIIVSELVFVLYPVYLGTFAANWGLPLQLCDITALVTGFGLLTGHRFALEWGYFLGLSATLLTTFSPDLEHDFPHVEFWCFFLTHALVSVAVLYSAFGLDRRPRPGAGFRVWAGVNLYGLAAIAINLRLSSNYLYICWKPGVHSPFDYLGPWPFYVLALNAILYALVRGLAVLAERAPCRALPAAPS